MESRVSSDRAWKSRAALAVSKASRVAMAADYINNY